MSRLIVTAGRNLQTLPASVFSRIVQPFLRASCGSRQNCHQTCRSNDCSSSGGLCLMSHGSSGKPVEQRSIGPHVHGADSVRERDRRPSRSRANALLPRRSDCATHRYRRRDPSADAACCAPDEMPCFEHLDLPACRRSPTSRERWRRFAADRRPAQASRTCRARTIRVVAARRAATRPCSSRPAPAA